MRRATVIFCLLSVVAGPIAACGDTGDSKLSNGQDLPPGAISDSGNIDGTTTPPSDDSGSMPDDSGSSDPDTGSMENDSGQKPKDSGSGVDSSFDAGNG